MAFSNITQSAYQRYLRSAGWRARRNLRVAKAGGQCEYRPPTTFYKGDYLRGDRCSVTDRLEVHHRHYETLGRETDDDLMLLHLSHHLVLTVLDAHCEFCGNELVNHEADALDLVDRAYDEAGCPADEMALDDVLAALTWLRNTGTVVCDYCDHMLSKDD